VVDEQAQAPGTDETGPDDPPAVVAAGGGADEAGEGDEAGQGGEAAHTGPVMTQVTLRHAPRYRAFVFAGIAVGLIAALLLITVLPVADGASPRTVFLYLAMPLALFGGLGGAWVALLVERRR
jgi:uncharacterized membrane protein YsdA (DUF1294 family)